MQSVKQATALTINKFPYRSTIQAGDPPASQASGSVMCCREGRDRAEWWRSYAVRPKPMHAAVPGRIHADLRGPASHSFVEFCLRWTAEHEGFCFAYLPFASADRFAFASRGRSCPLASILPPDGLKCIGGADLSWADDSGRRPETSFTSRLAFRPHTYPRGLFGAKPNVLMW